MIHQLEEFPGQTRMEELIPKLVRINWSRIKNCGDKGTCRLKKAWTEEMKGQLRNLFSCLHSETDTNLINKEGGMGIFQINNSGGRECMSFLMLLITHRATASSQRDIAVALRGHVAFV